MITIEGRQEIRLWASALAREAGEKAVNLLQEKWTVDRKADGTVVTDVDRAIERFLRERITAHFPTHSLFGEEYGVELRAPDAPLWAIDPIDGTTNLTNGLPQWGVSLGLIEGGIPIVGALCFPLLHEWYDAAFEGGASHNGQPLPLLPPGGETSWDDVHAICSYSVRRVDFEPIPVRLRITGSAALDLCWTAAGRLCSGQSIGVSLYDVAGGLCVAHEVGADALWLQNGEMWSAADMQENGKRPDDVLLTATLATRAYMREHLRLVR